jgi:ubiquinone/menaquinone biosynthesis C-methylase UbiE
VREAEPRRVGAAYARRREKGLDSRYSHADPANLYLYQQRERALLESLARHGLLPLTHRRILDVGCGDGSLLRDLTRYGARPENLAGADLLSWRLTAGDSAGAVLAAADARRLPFADAGFDLVLAFTLLSSVVEAESRRLAASEMVRVLRPGGLALVYDFWLNPTNPDVRPVRLAEMRRLFAGCRVEARRLTLAPPLLRLVAPRSWLACYLLEKVPFLQTHHLSAITKGDQH